MLINRMTAPLLGTGLVFLVSCSAPVQETNVEDDKLTKLMGGSGVVSVLRRPETVVAVLQEPPAFDSDTMVDPANYKPSSEEVTVSAAVANRIADALLDPLQNVQPEGAKGCIPYYGLRLTYIAGNDRVDLHVCLLCAVLAVDRNGKPVGGSHIDGIDHILLAEAAALFPHDSALQDLAKRRLK